jgi:hypothetical protein
MIRHALKSRRLRVLATATALMVGGLLTVNASAASAHDWGTWHWNKGGSSIVIQSYIYGGHTAEANAAASDAWSKVSILYNYSVTSHTDVSVFDGNYGDTGWAGLASIENWSGDHILHAHAVYNTYYPTTSAYIQGIYCQEDFHTYGFDHSATNDCMGLGYYYNDTYYLGPHNNSDFDARYRYHAVV